MRGLVVLGAMLGFVILLRRRPALIVLAAILLWIFIPYVAIPIAWGSNPALSMLTKTHPATMLMLVGLYVVVLKDMPSFIRHILRSGGINFALGVFLIAVTIGFTFVAASGFGVIVDQLVGPLIGYVLLRFDLSRNPAAKKTVIYGLIGAATAQSILIVAQSTTKRMVLYEHFYSTQYSSVLSHDRWFGTLGHPLVFGLFLACMTFLLAEIPSVSLRFTLATAFMIGIIFSQSRTALIVCAVGVVFLVLRSGAKPWQRLVLVSLACVTPIIMWGSFASSNAYSRFITDTGSATTRKAAVGEFLTQGFGNFLHGGGSGYSYKFSSNNHLISSLENPFMMYSLDFGLIPTMLYFGAMIWLVINASHRRDHLQFTLAATAAIVLILTFSSIAAEGASAFFLWTILALLPEKSRNVRPSPIAQQSKPRLIRPEEESSVQQWSATSRRS